METEMESASSSSSTDEDGEMKTDTFNGKLNTRGCCFLCLKVVDFQIYGDNDNQEETETTTKQTVSLKHIRRYLQIKIETGRQSVTKKEVENEDDDHESLSLQGNYSSEDIKVDLCWPCSKIILNFSRLFLSLEKIQMEVNYSLERINKQISEAFKNPDRVQIYSKRMTRDTESLPHLVIVDDFRKEIAWKSLLTRTGWEPNLTINLEPIPVQKDSQTETEVFPIKTEHPTEDQHQDSSPSGDYFPLDFDNAHQINLESYPQEETNQPSSSTPLPVSDDLDSPAVPVPLQIESVHSLDVPTEKMWSKNSKRGKFYCAACKKPFHTSKSARLHYESTHLFKTYKCLNCESTFTSQHGLKLHQEKCDEDTLDSGRKKVVYNSKTGKFSCNACKKIYSAHSGAWYHYQRVHLKKYFKCEICKLSGFGQRSTLERHMETCRETLEKRLALNEARKADFKFACKYCDKRFAIKSQVVKHQKYVHENFRRYKCDLCEKTFKQSSHLSRHKDSAHFGRRWECKMCGKEFNYEDNFLHHKRNCKKKKEKSKSKPEVKKIKKRIKTEEKKMIGTGVKSTE